MPKVSVTIVAYNSEKFLRGCLNSLKEQSFRDFEVIIVDNNSSDGTASLISKDYPEYTLIRSKTNSGYCKAQNIAINISRGEYILTLNPDIELHPRFLEEMVAIASSDDKIGSVAPKLLILRDGIKTDTIDSVGHAIEKSRYVRNIGSGQIDRGQFGSITDLFGVSGAAPLHRKAMLENIRYKDEFLDEDLFLGYDDVDLDWRSKLKGWRTVYAPKAVAWHIRSASSKRSSRMWNFYNYRNRYLVLIKNDSIGGLLKNLPYIALYEIGIVLTMAIQFQLFPVIMSVMKTFPKIAKKRARNGKAENVYIFLK